MATTLLSRDDLKLPVFPAQAVPHAITLKAPLGRVRDGFEVQVVADGGGSPSKMADDISLRRMERGGVTLTTTNQLIAELAGSWTTPEGGQLVQVLMTALQA
jgi:hypothetical protein